MNTEPISNYCPKCHAPLPASAPEGLCRKCLLAAIATPTEAGQPANAGATVPPPLETVAAAFDHARSVLSAAGAHVTRVRFPTFKAIAAMAPGELLEVTASDPAFGRDIRAWSARTGHELLSVGSAKGVITARVRKAPTPIAEAASGAAKIRPGSGVTAVSMASAG